MSIKYKILLPLQLMVFAIITTVSYLYISNMQEYIKKSSLQKLEVIGSVTNDKINLYVQQQQDKVELFNTRRYLYNKLAQYEKEKSVKIKTTIENILDFTYSKEEDIVDIVILDSDFNIIASKLNKIITTNPFLVDLKEMRTTVHKISLVFKNTTDAPLLCVSAPLFKEDKLIGTSIFIIKLTYLKNILMNEKQIGKTGEILMGIESGEKLIVFTPLKEILDYRKEDVMFWLSYNKTLKASILVKQDLAELMLPIEKIKFNQLIILLIGSFFILLTGLIISNKMIEIIEDVVRITSNISNGKLKERIKISTKDELGTLARSVNKMADFMLNANEISQAEVFKQTKLLQESNDKLAQNNKNLSGIIKSLSHDIKTPLTIIDGYLEEIEDGLVKCDDIAEVTKVLKRETAYLNELTSEVIGFIQSQEIVVSKKETVFLKKFLESEVFPLLRTKEGVELICDVDEKEKLEFNPTALKKILINLLHNASKYTSKGEIRVVYKNAKILIEDTGIGIDKEESKTIFEPFVCLDESRNRQSNGFGLGLSIASNLAKNSGYELLLDSSYENGCRFILKLSVKYE